MEDNLISTMANFVRRKISDEISDIVFFSLSADGTTNRTLCEQMTVLLRYVIYKHDNVKMKGMVIYVRQRNSITGERSNLAKTDFLEKRVRSY